MTLSQLEKHRARTRAYYHRHAEKCKAKTKAWRAANPERTREINRKAFLKWSRANPEINRLRSNRGTRADRMFGDLCSLLRITKDKSLEKRLMPNVVRAQAYNRFAFHC